MSQLKVFHAAQVGQLSRQRVSQVVVHQLKPRHRAAVQSLSKALQPVPLKHRPGLVHPVGLRGQTLAPCGRVQRLERGPLGRRRGRGRWARLARR